MREAAYRRLRRHWQFINELSLFEVHHLVSFGVHIYAADSDPGFLQATSLYHPDTVERSLKHDGSGSEPGLKDDGGKWDLRPHASRIQRVDPTTLGTWHAVLESDDVPVSQSRMVYTVNRSTAAVLDKLASAPRVAELGLSFSSGWHEKNDRTRGYFDAEWRVPESWDSVILQGPHLHVANPFYKQPNRTMRNNQDWTPVDLEALAEDAIPATQYQVRGDVLTYDNSYGRWRDGATSVSARGSFRIAWRTMAANTGERTLIPTLIPPGAAHIHRVSSAGSPKLDARSLSIVLGCLSSLLSDFLVRAVPKSDILMSTLDRLPLVSLRGPLGDRLARQVSRLNCLTRIYAPFWTAVSGDAWTPSVPYRRALARRTAQVEVDALVACALQVPVDDLLTVYRTQFPVLRGYDSDEYVYDSNGRAVPVLVRNAWRKAGRPASEDGFDPEAWTATHPQSGVPYRFKLPFRAIDRAEELRLAYEIVSRDYLNAL